MEQFNWGTDDDRESPWQEDPSPPENTPWRKKIRRSAIIFFIFILAGGGVWGANRLANATIEQAEQETQAEVLASYRLLKQAESEADDELLTNLISGRSRRWVNAQKTVFESGFWFDRPPLGLVVADSPESSGDPPTITLSSDLNTAVVETALHYESPDLTVPVELVRVELYRRGQNGWLLSPFDGEEWQSSAQFNSPVLKATFPLADREIGERLTTDLSQMIVDLCEKTFELTCNFDALPLEIDFLLDPQTLVDIQRPTSSIRSIRRLPAPTLIGRPVDEDGYQALFIGYSRLLIEPWLLQQEQLFWVDQPRMAQVASHIRFEQTRPDGKRPSLAETAWVTAAEQDIALLCLQRDTVDLVRLTPDPSQFDRLSTGLLASDLLVDSVDQRLAIRGVREDFRMLKMWPLDVQNFPLDIANNLQIDDEAAIYNHPEGSGLIINRSRNLTFDTDRVTLTCGERVCRANITQLLTEMSWSPNGQRTVSTENRIFLGDHEGNPILFLGEGYATHWVSDDRIRYVGTTAGRAFGPSSRQDLLEYTISTLTYRKLLTAEDFSEYLPEPEGEALPAIWAALHLEDAKSLLFVEDNGTLAQFIYDGQTQALFLVWHEFSPRLFSFLISPDNRYLIHNRLHENGNAALDLIDLDTGALRPVGEGDSYLERVLPEMVALDWSRSGRQLLIVTPGQVMVYEPDSDQLAHWPMPESLDGCFEGSWIGPLE